LISWKKRIAKLGWLLIVVGVLGEGIYEYSPSIADGVLEEFNDIVLTDAQKEAAFAIEGLPKTKEKQRIYARMLKMKRKRDKTSKAKSPKPKTALNNCGTLTSKPLQVRDDAGQAQPARPPYPVCRSSSTGRKARYIRPERQKAKRHWTPLCSKKN
jgi:hypothetical protein